MNRKIGMVTKKVIKLLDLGYKKEIPIYIGEDNINHMKREHIEAFTMYSSDIEDIINNPTYVAKNPKQGSIEYIKEYQINDEFVLVAVRATNNGRMFARTMFIMTQRKKNIYLSKRIC